MMTKQEIAGDWNTLVGAVLQKFGQVTGDEVSRLNGNVDQLIGLIQKKTGQSREQIEAFVQSCSSKAASSVSQLAETAGEYVGGATSMIRDNYDRVSSEAKRNYDETLNTVSKRPLESMAITLGLGVLTGVIVGLSLANRRG